MCSSMCWMLQAWMPPFWALIGGLLPVLRFGVFSWGESYWGGAPAAIGGALVLGALPRILRTQRVRDALLLALGVGMLANSRPYEGFLLCLPVAAVLIRWALGKYKRKPVRTVFLRRVVLPASCSLLLLGAITTYYFWRVTGSPLRMPYQVNRDTYSMARYFYWQQPHAVPAYHHDEMRRFYLQEFERYKEHRSLLGFLWETGYKLISGWLFYVGPALTIPLFTLPWLLRDRRIRILVTSAVVGAAGIELVIYFAPNYAAPFTCVIVALIVQGLRHLRGWRPDRRPVGAFLSNATMFICLLMLPIQVVVLWTRAKSPNWHSPGIERQQILEHLCSLPEKQLVLVRYRPDHDVLSEEWVYNEADLEHSKVIWARDMDPQANQDLISYYKDREVWLVDVDAKPPELTNYSSQTSDAQFNPSWTTVTP
jgi:hypothetical protein